MSQAADAPTRFRTVAELLHRLGDVPADRVRLQPSPGTATERDLLRPEGRLCELVEGVLVEKAMGFAESLLVVELILALGSFVKAHRLGMVTGADGMVRLFPGLVRIPDVAFFSWDRIPGDVAPSEPVPALAPDLAVEVLNRGNTKREMERKLREYFEAGVRLVWMIDPKTRTARIFTSPEASTRLGEGQRLDGGDVLPGFALPLGELFECLRRGPEV